MCLWRPFTKKKTKKNTTTTTTTTLTTTNRKHSDVSQYHIELQNRNKNVLVMYLKYTPVTQSMLCLTYLMNVAPLKLRFDKFFKKRRRKKELMILIHLWPWNKVRLTKPGINWYTPSKVIIMQSLKDFR